MAVLQCSWFVSSIPLKCKDWLYGKNSHVSDSQIRLVFTFVVLQFTFRESKVEVKSAYDPSDPSGRRLSSF